MTLQAAARAFVEINGYYCGDCWVADTFHSKGGYAMFRHGGENFSLHRALAGLEPGDPRVSRHLCGNRACVNENHLRAGTQTENMADKVGHGTSGHRKTLTRLTAKDTPVMRHHLKPGRMKRWLSQMILKDQRADTEIAKAFGVTVRAVRAIKIG